MTTVTGKRNLAAFTDAELTADDFEPESPEEILAQREAWSRRARRAEDELHRELADPGLRLERQTRALFAAMAAFQAELPEVVQDSIAKVEAKSGAKFTYGYAGLAAVAGAVLPALGRHGLAYVCTFDHKQNLLVGQVVHRDGGSFESTWQMPGGDDPQKIGSAMTYGRRYLLLCMTGAHPAGEDDDGAAAKHVHDRPRDDASHDQPMSAEQRQSAQAVAPLAAVIAKGRQAGLNDGEIKLALDGVAKGRDHGTLTRDELRGLWAEFNEAAKVVAELEEDRIRQEQAAAEVGTGTSTVDESARPEVGDADVFVQAGEVVSGEEQSTVDSPARPEGTQPSDPHPNESATIASLRRQIDPKTSAADFAAAQKAATDQLAKEGDDGRVSSRKRA